MNRFAQSLFVIALCVLSFLYGFVSIKAGLFPSAQLNSVYLQARSLISPSNRPNHVFPIVHEPAGANVIDDDAIQPGLTLITSFFPELDWGPGAKLIARDGKVLHVWATTPSDIWPERANEFRDSYKPKYIHGIYLYPDGDIIFNIDYQGMVRMDSCGNIKWRTEERTHHSINSDQDGNFWASAYVMQNDQEYARRFARVEAPFVEEHAILVSPDGEVLKDINLLEVLYSNRLERYLTKLNARRSGDILHLNDIEPLLPHMADEYPLFEAGDIAVSLKFIDMVLVMNPDTGIVKWHEADQLRRHHDPDFLGSGWIGVFDNNVDTTPRGTMLGGSRIIAFKPSTGDTKVIYPTPGAESFYTPQGGKWQQLDNGNALIAEAQAGRLFEATPEGKIVWEWVQNANEESLVPEVFEGTRYPLTPEQVAQWSCNHNDPRL